MNTKRKVYGIDLWVVGILLVGALLRSFHLSTLTEFLGDQGRTMLVMSRFVEEGVVPLAGPLTQTNHNLGPIFYYLLIPGYMFTHSPFGVSLWMAILGVLSVYIVYETGKRMFGVVPGRYISFLWAVSPVIVQSDRVIWEPNLVPLFSILFVYLLYRAYHEWRPMVWVLVGVVVGILIQLHYPNVYFVGLTGLCFIGALGFRTRTLRELFWASLWWLAGCVASMAPFLWYEYGVGFRDIQGVASVMGSGGVWLGKRAMLLSGLDYLYRVFGRMIPHMDRTPAGVFFGVISIFTLFRPSKKNLFFFVWLSGGIIAMTRYSEVVHDHYLYFLVPVPFLILGSGISAVKKIVWRTIVYGALIILCGYQIMHTDMFGSGRNDIGRVSQSVLYIQKKAQSRPFSFTLIGSRSYSDLHYRYYMKVLGITPSSATDQTYTRLFVVCDNDECPHTQAITSLQELPILCFEEHCRQYYPTIPLMKEWKYVHDEKILVDTIERGRVYEFERK